MVPPMQRFEILFPVKMLSWLRAESARRGVGVCEIVRGLIQREMDRK
jgi:hypothetical protein